MYGVTRIPFLHTVFFIFDSTIRCTVMGGAWAHIQTWWKKVINCAQIGCHSFHIYYIPRCTIMRNEVFVYLEIYSVYLEIYYGVFIQGIRFPDVTLWGHLEARDAFVVDGCNDRDGSVTVASEDSDHRGPVVTRMSRLTSQQRSDKWFVILHSKDQQS